MTNVSRLTILSALILVIGCVSPAPFAQETVGERFRKVLSDIDADCRELKLGPYLDPNDPEYRRKRRGTDCDILKLEPRDWRTEKLVKTEGQLYPVPERWLAEPGGRFAHSIRLPAPYDQLRSVLLPGMSGTEYFDALCKAEAGEVILQKVDGVEGIRLDRPPRIDPSGYRDLVFHTSEWSGLGFPDSARLLIQLRPGKYHYVDIRLSTQEAARRGGEILRLVSTSLAGSGGRVDPARSYRNSDPTIREEVARSSTAPYIATWRGIRRPSDWEHGIYGQEVIVLQDKPLRILGIRRSFTRYESFGSGDPRDVFPRPCPSDVGKLLGAAERYVRQVLQPRFDQ